MQSARAEPASQGSFPVFAQRVHRGAGLGAACSQKSRPLSMEQGPSLGALVSYAHGTDVLNHSEKRTSQGTTRSRPT